MDRKTKAEYLARLGFRVAFGCVLYANAVTRRKVREVKNTWLP